MEAAMFSKARDCVRRAGTIFKACCRCSGLAAKYKHGGHVQVAAVCFKLRCRQHGLWRSAPGADEMSALRQIEKGRQMPVDNLLNIFMKGCAAENREEHLITDFMLHQLDLELCEDTLVGNDWFRGVSGGQRKRVSAGVVEQTLLSSATLSAGEFTGRLLIMAQVVPGKGRTVFASPILASAPLGVFL